MDDFRSLLAELGFSEYLIKAYLGLLSLGSACTAYELSRKSGIPLSKIYEVIDSLIGKGLAYIVPGKPKRFMIVEPRSALKNLLFKQQESISELSKKVDMLTIPKSSEEAVMIFKGGERLGIFENDLKNATKYSYSFFQTIPAINHPISEIVKSKLKEGVDIKGIVCENEVNLEGFKLWNKKFPGVYKLKKVLYSSRLGVIDDSIVRFTVMSGGEPIMVRVVDADLAKLFKETFLREWGEN